MNPSQQAAPAIPSTATEEIRTKNNELLAVFLEYVPLIGKPLATMARQGRLGWLFSFMVFMVFALLLPLIYPLLAALYLNVGLLPEPAHQWYADQVVSAFRVRESAQGVTAAANRSLDYFQVIEFIDDAKVSREYSISLAQSQRALFVVERATLRSSDPKHCPIPSRFLKKNAVLMQLNLFDRPLLSIQNSERSKPYILSAEDWKAINSHMDSTNRATLVLQPVDELANLQCDGVNVDLRISIEVFKDFVESPKSLASQPAK